MLGLSIISIILVIFHDITVAWSFFVGGLAGLLPNFYQAMSLFKESYASAAGRIVRRLYRAELIKFFTMAALFIALMHWTHLNVLAFVIGFICTEIGIWMVLPILINIKR